MEAWVLLCSASKEERKCCGIGVQREELGKLGPLARLVAATLNMCVSICVVQLSALCSLAV